MISALVIGLNVPSRPANVTGLVMARIVYAVDAVSWSWLQPNMPFKGFKIRNPRFVHPDALSPVIFIVRVLWIGATVSNPGPDPVSHCAASAVLPSDTAAALGPAGLEVIGLNNHVFPTIAGAMPLRRLHILQA
jgi:hypothetical protein